MGERKVQNKYYSPDFDPSKLSSKVRSQKKPQSKVRMMLPMSIRCKTCKNYIYKGTKFNSRKEGVEGEKYLGIKIFRFYFKCTNCSAEVSMKTDPKNSDYAVEFGATRNFEPWRAEEEEVDTAKRKRKAEEMGDAMKSLENRTLDWKREMDTLARLEELKSMKSRRATVGVDKTLEALQRKSADKEKTQKRLEEEDEALVKYIFHRSKDDHVKRIEDDDDDDTSSKRRKTSQDLPTKPTDHVTTAKIDDKPGNKGNKNGSGDTKFLFGSSTVRVAVIKKKPAPLAKVQSMFQGYGEDDDDDDDDDE